MKKVFLSILMGLFLTTTLFVGIASANTNDDGLNDTKLTYDSTEQAQDSIGGEVNIFVDEVDNKYIFDDNGKQVGFIKADRKTATYSSHKIDLNDAIRIADDVLLNTIDVNHNHEYTMTDAVYIDDMEIFSITYHFLIDDFLSSDFVFVTLSCDGEILSYAAPNIGAFECVDIPCIDKSEIQQKVVNHITQTYDYIDYSIDNMVLVKNSGLTLLVSYSVTLSDETYVADSFCIDLT